MNNNNSNFSKFWEQLVNITIDQKIWCICHNVNLTTDVKMIFALTLRTTMLRLLEFKL
jgi:hypothetical protein